MPIVTDGLRFVKSGFEVLVRIRVERVVLPLHLTCVLLVGHLHDLCDHHHEGGETQVNLGHPSVCLLGQHPVGDVLDPVGDDHALTLVLVEVRVFTCELHQGLDDIQRVGLESPHVDVLAGEETIVLVLR